MWHKWYFDELIDALVVRPAAAAGRFAQDTFERVFVEDTMIGGTTGVVRAGSAAVRAVQSGFLRYYAALLVLGVTGVGLLLPVADLMPALSILIWLPAALGLLGALFAGRNHRVPGVLALIGSIAALGLAIGYIAEYSPGTHGLTNVTDVVWISELGIHYKLGISGLNVFLIGLTTLLFAAATIAANLRTWQRPKLFWFFFMLAESAVLGAFLAQDLALFVAFFDLMLIPFYFLTGMWGRGTREERVKATIKLVIYTLVGSLLMLAAAVATGVLAAQQGGGHITFVLSALQAVPLSRGSQEWIFLFFAAAFLVKMPAFPLHGWMPDGYRAMPIEVLMVFSGVLSKVGAYGFLAIVLPLFPQGAAHFQTLMLIVALVSIIYGSAVAFTQTDARLIAGYSSVAQLGFITLGIFALNPQGAQGALLADGQPRPRRRAAPVHRRDPLAPRAGVRRTCATWAGSRSARRCSLRSS